MRIHGLMPRAEAEREGASTLFRALALPDPETIGARYPHQVSGGQLQRLMAAMALMTDPRAGDLRRADHRARRHHADRGAARLQAGRARARHARPSTSRTTSRWWPRSPTASSCCATARSSEIGRDRADPRRAPQHPYTREPAGGRRTRGRAPRPNRRRTPTPLLEVRRPDRGLRRHGRATAAAGAGPARRQSFGNPRAASALGVIGESGCGQDHPRARDRRAARPAREPSCSTASRCRRASRDRTREQLRRIQIVFQMADTALNPPQTIGRIIGRPLAFYHGPAGRGPRGAGSREMLDLVRLPAVDASTGCRASCPAARSSGSTSPGRSRPSRRSCCATRSPPRSTRSSARRSSISERAAAGARPVLHVHQPRSLDRCGRSATR